MSPIGMHVASEAAITVACFSAAFAILWYVLNREGLGRETRRAGYLLFTCFLACGLSRLADVAAVAHPDLWILDYIDALFVAISLASAIAVWPLLPELARLPSSVALQRANAQLAAKEQARSILMERLTDVNRDLERRVAERTAELLAANRRFEAALSGSNISVAQQNRDLEYTWAYNMLSRFATDDVIGRTNADVLGEESAARLDRTQRAVLETGAPGRFEVSADIRGEKRWFEERVEPLIEEGLVVGIISTAVDVTLRKRHEIELVDLLRELTHRSKNLLAVVQGIARQTGRSSTSVSEFTERFGARLQALSLAHELLVTNAWRGADMRKLVEGVIAHVAPERAGSVEIEGPAFRLSPETSQTLVMALHEMASNAAAYGGLSSERGSLRISWQIESPSDAPGRLHFSWTECGLGASKSERSRGFGFSFVEALLPRALVGESTLDFREDGLTWKLSFPLAHAAPVSNAQAAS